jgi:hypothetical protein
MGKLCFVIAREDLSGWPEARALTNANAENIKNFIYEDIICRYGIIGRMVVDGGPENKNVAEALLEVSKITRVKISPYNSKANGIVERGHRPIVDGLSKLTNGGFKKWP